MKYFLTSILIFASFLIEAQPIPDCAQSTTNKRLFVKSQQNLVAYLRVGNAYPSEIDSTIKCFSIDYSDIKDSLDKIFFDFKIYKTIIDYDLDQNRKKPTPYMHIYICRLNFKDSLNKYSNDIFNLFIEIPKFIEGSYYIDVSKNITNTILVNCNMCSGTISALNITPNKWKKKKKRK